MCEQANSWRKVEPIIERTQDDHEHGNHQDAYAAVTETAATHCCNQKARKHGEAANHRDIAVVSLAAAGLVDQTHH